MLEYILVKLLEFKIKEFFRHLNSNKIQVSINQYSFVHSTNAYEALPE